jgi:hypothetical protein
MLYMLHSFINTCQVYNLIILFRTDNQILFTLFTSDYFEQRLINVSRKKEYGEE